MKRAGPILFFLILCLLTPEVRAPVTIDDTELKQSGQESNQRKLVRNPRGMNQYYAVFQSGDTSTVKIFNSSDGVSWNYTGVSINSYMMVTVTLWEDAGDNRSILVVVHPDIDDNDNDIVIKVYAINDTEVIPQLLWSGLIWANPGITTYYPSLCIDDDGYLWVGWAHRYNSKGKPRNDIWLAQSDSAYPESAPSWYIVKVFDGKTATNIPVFRPQTALGPLTATADIAMSYNIDLYSTVAHTDPLRGLTATRGNPPVLSAHFNISDAVGRRDLSLVVEDSPDSDVFVMCENTTHLNVWKWDISAGSASFYGEPLITTLANTYSWISISIDYSRTPDLLWASWGNTTAGYFYYTRTSVESADWIDIVRVYDGIDPEGCWTGSSSYWDWNNDGSIYIIYVREEPNVNYEMRFYEHLRPVEPVIVVDEEFPVIPLSCILLLFGFFVYCRKKGRCL